MPNHCQIFGRMIRSDAGRVFIEGYIQAIMKAVLNPTMLSPCMRKLLHAFHRSNRIAYLGGLDFTYDNLRTYHAKARQSRPVCGILQSGQIREQVMVIRPFLDSSVSLVNGFACDHFRISLRMLQRILETGFRVFMERRLILPEAEHIVALTGNYPLCIFPLAAHGGGGNDAPAYA